MNKKVAFKTLGCRLNQYETDSLVSEFTKNGYEVVPFGSDADAYIINTCTVTNQSDHKSRNLISQAIRRKEDKLLVVTGCMANHKKSILESNQNINYVVDNEHKSSIFPLINKHFLGEESSPDDFEKDLFNFEIGETTQHVRSMVKIQDGCDNFCTFCIIPFVRGRASSRPVNDILDNIRKLIDLGYQEMVLTGVNIGRYAYKGHNFEDLLEKILALPGDFRIRISSIEPEGFGDKLYGMLNHPKLAPHMHVCLQSGSEKILLKMRRMYTARSFFGMTERMKEFRPDMNLTTDVIVGFPGETDEDFQDTYNMVKKIGFSHVHTFKYSKRDGTRSARMTELVPEKIKKERSEQIRLLSEENKRAYRSAFIGKEQELIIEKVKIDHAEGHGQHFIPIKIPGSGFKKNQKLKVVLSEMEPGDDPALWSYVK